VTNALQMIDAEKGQVAGLKLTSILFPLMGTGVAHLDFDKRVDALLDAAIEYLIANPGSKVEKVCFLAYSDRDLEVCQRLLETNPAKVSAPVEAKTVADVKPLAAVAQGAAIAPPPGPKPEPGPEPSMTISENTTTTTVAVENKETTISEDAATP
jgi:hypothetical protein